LNDKPAQTPPHNAAPVNDRPKRASTAALVALYFTPLMPKRTARTDLYRLIFAGHLARQALLAPLARLGLAAGDDAVLLALAEAGKSGMPATELAEATGMPDPMLAKRLERLIEFDQVERCALGPDLTPGVDLTGAGRDNAEVLLAHWLRLEDALMGELSRKDRKKLRRILKRFNALLALQVEP